MFVYVVRRQRLSCPRWGAAGSAGSPAGTDGLQLAPGCAWPQPEGGLGGQEESAGAWAGGGRPEGWREPSPSRPGRTHLLTGAGGRRKTRKVQLVYFVFWCVCMCVRLLCVFTYEYRLILPCNFLSSTLVVKIKERLDEDFLAEPSKTLSMEMLGNKIHSFCYVYLNVDLRRHLLKIKLFGKRRYLKISEIKVDVADHLQTWTQFTQLWMGVMWVDAHLVCIIMWI